MSRKSLENDSKTTRQSFKSWFKQILEKAGVTDYHGTDTCAVFYKSVKMFAYIKKKQYLCSRFRKLSVVWL